MGELAGKDAFPQKDPFTEVETVVIEAAEVALAKSRERVKQTTTEGTSAEPNETPAEAAGRELDPATPNAQSFAKKPFPTEDRTRGPYRSSGAEPPLVERTCVSRTMP